MKVNILGTEYTVVDKSIKEAAGYCDHTTKQLIIDSDLLISNGAENEAGDLVKNRKRIVRHEAIHALGFESGLGHDSPLQDEIIIDWIARMYPRMKEIFKQLDVED